MILKFKKYDCSFTFGKLYICLGISFDEYRQITQVSVRRDSDQTPVLMNVSMFDIIDPEIPQGWNISINEYEGKIRTFIEPKEFSGKFWNMYHDGDQEAERIFERVYGRLIKHYKFYFDGV